jgi:hypothetical protein
MDQVEGPRGKLAVKDVVEHQPHVGEPLRGHELCGGFEHRHFNVGSDDLAARADPLAQQPQPSETAAPDVNDPPPLSRSELFKKAPPGRLPRERLELKSLQLGQLSRHQILRHIRNSGTAPFLLPGLSP